MASKRKSTVPCMIPSKSKHVREEIILGSLPELLPTIPEDSILSISGKESGHFSHTASKHGSETQKGGTYSCVTCQFESRDLNYFLDHMHNCHLDFRAQPTFYCLNCAVSVVRFEALALHNAKAHPKIMEGLVTASLGVSKRDGVTTVEQSLFTESGEDHRESGISLTKTPIAKMMKGKGEHKKIVVSHTVEVRKINNGKDADILTNVPELQNGALSVSSAPAMPRTAVNHMVTTVSNQVFHQHTPSLYPPPPSDTSKDLPKVMIPLSSIPTYNAAMDTSSFLKTSFGKFPYPTKAELCYLTVVSEFPEEQIKLWFTAQRLKQGISWSPEEIEEARRKMFNTVFQGGAPQKQPAAPRQVNHIVTHHTVPGHLGLKGPNFQMAKVPYVSVKSRPVGVITTQASMSTNPHVTRVSYSTPVAPPKFPSIARTPSLPLKGSETSVEPEKSNGLDGTGGAACVSSSRSSSCSSSSSSISSYSSSSNGMEMVARKPPPNSSLTSGITTSSASISNNDEPNATDSPIGPDPSSSTSHVIINNTSKANNTCPSHDSAELIPQQPGNAENPNNKHTNVFHKTNNGSIRSEHLSLACEDQNHASKSPSEGTSTVITKSNSSSMEEGSSNKDLSMKGMSILQQLIEEEETCIGEKSGSELKVDPIKINFKRMKMNEPETAPEVAQPEHKSDIEVSACHSSFSPPWSTKTPRQLQVLRQVFSSTRWPSSLQYEELSIQTGLPKSEVVRWFSDSRYSHKNGQLKWLESYQQPEVEAETVRGPGDAGSESRKESSVGTKNLVEQDTNKHLEEGALKPGQRVAWQDSYSPLLVTRGDEAGRGEESKQFGALQDLWSEKGDDNQQPGANQSLIKQTDGSQARDGPRMELLEV